MHAFTVWAGKAASCYLLTDRLPASVALKAFNSKFLVDSSVSFYTSSCIIHLQYVTALLLLSSRVGQLCPCLLRPCVTQKVFFPPNCWRSNITVLFSTFLTFLHNFLSDQACSVSSHYKIWKGEDISVHTIKAYGGGEGGVTGIAPLIHNLGSGWSWVVNSLQAPSLYTPVSNE